jgi:hypothetical protein
MCDLKLTIAGTPVEVRTDRILQELELRDLRLRPYFWLSDDWFTPEGLTGIAVPFYLAHPRLMRLERNQIGEVEGGTAEWCMRFLRHEVGHAITHAYLLNLRRKWQQLFGLSSYSYPRFYRPNPYSKRHVQHLEYWYAQSHPDEDFAETFAVWLQPRSLWRKRYRGWPVMKKLVYVDELMSEIAGQKPRVVTRAKEDTLASMRKTLREHYFRKRAGMETEFPNRYDQDLKRLFIAERRTPRSCQVREAASAFIRRFLPEIKQQVLRWTGEYRYQLDHVLRDMIGRCRELKLYADGSERQTWQAFSILLVKHTMDSLYRQRYWVEM